MWHILIWHWSETVFGAGVIGLRNAGFFLFSGYLMKIKKDEIIGLETG